MPAAEATTATTGSAAGAAEADALLEPLFSSLRASLGEIRIFDCHTHLAAAASSATSPNRVALLI
jgi:hypothetical protein